ncbi:MAG: DnaB-like helicase N-terminal domain-containing protein, partial [Lachnoclostridium sp.]|nr:DnaB-like helicase N-terminal domain-containing protein [Lachnoclostridium sp.]
MDESAIKRIMPHSTEAEQSVLGSMLIDNDTIQIAAEILTGEDFYSHQYGLIFDAIVALDA